MGKRNQGRGNHFETETSQNTKESEVSRGASAKTGQFDVLNLKDFATQKLNTKSPIESLVRTLCREVNRQKLNYDQLKYVFKAVRRRCDIEVPTKGRKLIELPTTEELARFYAQIAHPVHRLIFETLEGSGLRIAELCNLEVRRIDFKSNMIFVSEGKGQKDRLIVVGNKLLEKLALFLDGRNNRYLFESNRRTGFTPRRLEQLCLKYKIKAALEKPLTPHVFRHIWNTRLAEAGVNRERRAILAGHTDQKTQDIYTHLAAGELEIVKTKENFAQ